MSNLLQKASIILTPTAYKNNEVLCAKPSEAPYGDFDFTRNSSATRVNAQGLVEDVQILSSNLVQNGDFSQIGSEEVTNGNFSQIGSEEITNGNFSQEGSQLITNGDFATDSDWVKTGSIEIANGQAIATNASTEYLYQSTSLVVGKFYKITFTVSDYISGIVRSGLNDGLNNSGANRNANGTYTDYIKFTGGNTFVGVLFTNNASMSIDNVSCVEVGQDWTLGTGWSIGDDKAICDGTGNVAIFQANNFIDGKSYKITFDILDYTSGELICRFNGNETNTFNSVGSHTLYFTSDNSFDYVYFKSQSNFIGSITNISVKEVGQDWQLNGLATIGDDVASFVDNGANTNSSVIQDNVLLQNTTYKLTFDIVRYTSGALQVSLGNSSYINNSLAQGVGSYSLYVTTGSGSRIEIKRNGGVPNFDFDISNISVKEVGQNWTLNTVDFSLGSVVFDNLNDNIFQNKSFTVGKKYRLSFSGSGNLSYRTGYAGADSTKIQITLPHTVEIVATSNTNRIQPYGAVNGSQGTLTNISLIEITDDTNLPRINYSGFTYQDSLGSELVVNGDFATNSNWNLGAGQWTISNGFAVASNSATNILHTSSTVASSNGLVHKVIFTLSDVTSGYIKIGLSNLAATQYNSNGTYTAYIESGGNNYLYFHPYGFTGKISNVSVKEVLGKEVVPNSGCGSWLFEPESTNLITYSEDYTQWINSGTTFSANKIISPDGTLNAEVLVEDSTNGAHRMNDVILIDLGEKYSFSVFVKPVVGTRRFYIAVSPLDMIVYFDLQNETFTSTSGNATIEKMGDYYKCTVTSVASGSGSHAFRIGLSDGTSVSYQGDGVSSLAIWGVQLEKANSVGYNGEYATSYIPTEGTIKTRNKDLCTNGANVSLINSSEGVLYAEIEKSGTGTYRLISLNNGAASNSVTIGFHQGANNTFYFRVASSNGTVTYTTFPIDYTGFNKIALKYKSGEISAFVNGTKKVQSSATFSFASPLNELAFDYGSGGLPFFGNTKAVGVWKEALTDAELRSLTYPTPTAATFDLDFNTIATDFTFTRNSEATFVNAQGLIQSTNELGSEIADSSVITNENGGVITKNSATSYNAVSDGTSTSSNKPRAFFGNTFVGKTYKLVITPTNQSGTIICKFNNGSSFDFNNNDLSSEVIIYFVRGATTDPYISFDGRETFGVDFTVSVKEYITETNTPRLDYSTGAEAFLLEPQSTNTIINSNDVGAMQYHGGLIRSNNAAISPDNTFNAMSFIPTTTQAVHRSGYNSSSGVYAQGNTVTLSGFVKANGYNFITLGGFFGAEKAVYNISNGTVVSQESNVINTKIVNLTNGWYRVSTTYIFQNTINNGLLYSGIYVMETDNGYTFTGDGVSGIYGYGFQAEIGTGTSYIPTSGTTVTRNQELCNDATPVINSEEGVLYLEASKLVNGESSQAIGITDGSNNNLIMIQWNSTANRMYFFLRGGANSYESFNENGISQTNMNKIALVWDSVNFSGWINGVKVGTLAITNPPIGLNNLGFEVISTKFFGNTKGLKVYPKALSDLELETLTSWSSFIELAEAQSYIVE